LFRSLLNDDLLNTHPVQTGENHGKPKSTLSYSDLSQTRVPVK